MPKTTPLPVVDVRCSSLPQLRACPASVVNPDNLPVVKVDGDAATWGNIYHDVFEKFVETGAFDLKDVEARVPANELPRVQKLLDNFLKLWGEASQTMQNPVTEFYHEALLPGHRVKLTGHIDLHSVATVDGAPFVYILDYKTGRMKDDHYDQVVGYAYLLWDHLGQPETATFAVAVAYLEDLDVTSYSLAVDDLREWAAGVEKLAGTPEYRVQKRCSFCTLQDTCPSFTAYATGSIKAIMGAPYQKWKSLSPAERKEVLDRIYVVRRALDRANATLKASMTGVDSVDVGDDSEYVRTRTVVKSLDKAKAMPLLRRRLDKDVLAELATYSLSDVLAKVAELSPAGKKQAAKEAFLEKLAEAGAIIETNREMFVVRKKSQSPTEEESDA